MGKTYKDTKGKYDKFDHKKKVQYGKKKSPKQYDESSDDTYLKWKDRNKENPKNEL